MATKVLSNGAVYDLEAKRIVSGAVLTSDGARQLVAHRTERKRAVIAQAALDAVERDDYRAQYGGDAWIAAIAEAQMRKATTPDDPKSTDAARFLLTEAGIAEARQVETTHNTLNVIALPDAVARLLDRVAQAQSMNDETQSDAAADAGGV